MEGAESAVYEHKLLRMVFVRPGFSCEIHLQAQAQILDCAISSVCHINFPNIIYDIYVKISSFVYMYDRTKVDSISGVSTYIQLPEIQNTFLRNTGELFHNLLLSQLLQQSSLQTEQTKKVKQPGRVTLKQGST